MNEFNFFLDWLKNAKSEHLIILVVLVTSFLIIRFLTAFTQTRKTESEIQFKLIETFSNSLINQADAHKQLAFSIKSQADAIEKQTIQTTKALEDFMRKVSDLTISLTSVQKDTQTMLTLTEPALTKIAEETKSLIELSKDVLAATKENKITNSETKQIITDIVESIRSIDKIVSENEKATRNVHEILVKIEAPLINLITFLDETKESKETKEEK